MGRIESQLERDIDVKVFAYGGSHIAGWPEESFGFIDQSSFWLDKLFVPDRIGIINFGKSGKGSSYVREKLEQTIHHDPDAVIILSGNNEYLEEKNIETQNEFLDRFVKRSFPRSSLVRLLYNCLEPISARMRDMDVVLPRIGLDDRSLNGFSNEIERYRHNLQAIVQMLRRERVPLLLCTVPSNLFWPPIYKNMYGIDPNEKYERDVQNCLRLLYEGKTTEAKQTIREMAREDRDNKAMEVYLQGMLHYKLGEYKKAFFSLTAAKDLDPFPTKTLTKFNVIVREVSQEPGVYLVDLESFFRKKAKHGIVGYDLIGDNCHPTPLGHSFIAHKIVECISTNNILAMKNQGNGLCCPLDIYLDSIVQSEDYQHKMEKYLINTATFCMKPPFSNYRAARRCLDEALDTNQSNWRIWINHATVSIFERKIERGILELKRAKELKGGRLKATDGPWLGEALNVSGYALHDLEK